ncbi:hypothetical protein DICPUDRAFT_153292 [Dictyostelium purpureum]|uniref:Thioredoxin domain-containing protein n=1 Tax=Dictyostelium purpureum TaxID=5786 RepID=F0ZNJ8_DICPU|nr:uncharacterized protein DICPUDRAFT_153292 [Dictyostelium purpureum]EGC34498.1 hypothetical protein DICPUDRAFT_153292 [Dictyostelium purpureum]|eukprot:XP_003288987.1 hypothetical protein DICPUDRAFT_153292 [Dictyostelium purpureum]
MGFYRVTSFVQYSQLKKHHSVVVFFCNSSVLSHKIEDFLKKWAFENPGSDINLLVVNVHLFHDVKDVKTVTSVPTTRSYKKGIIIGEYIGSSEPSIINLIKANLNIK